MDPYQSVLEFFSGKYETLPQKNTDEYYDRKELIWDDINKLKWLTSYIDMVDDTKGCQDGLSKLDETKEIYVSCEEFPTIYINNKQSSNSSSSSEEELPEDSGPKYNVSYRYNGNYGSSAVCLYRRISSMKGGICPENLDDEAKKFVEFFTALGKSVCVIYENTYDSTVYMGNGQYQYNYKNTNGKLCVSSGVMVKDLE